MRYLSVCSGIEAASVAWHHLGWTPVGFSEIEPFPAAVLKHRFPNVPNYGDMTKFEEWPIEPGTVDILVGGTPCQSFSVAGLRKGLEDPRGNLMLTYLAIAARFKPRWVVWENVPGVLSSNGGRDFATFLGALGQLGYGWAYRVLDAQYVRVGRWPRAVPQRRRRVFVVGCLGDWAAPTEVLALREGLQRNLEASGKARKGVAPDAEGGARGGCITSHAVAPCLETTSNDYSRADGFTMIAGHRWPSDCAGTLAQSASGTGSPGYSNQEIFSQHGANLVPQPVPFRKAKRAQSATDDESWVQAQQANTLNAFDTGERDTHAIAIGTDCYNGAVTGDVAATMGTPGSSVNASGPTVMTFPIDTQNMTEGHSSGGLGFGQQGDPSFTVTKGHSHAVAFTVGNLARGQGPTPNSEVFPTLKSGGGRGTDDQWPSVMMNAPPAVAVAPSLTSTNDPSRSPQSAEVTQQVAAVHASTMTVRRLSPRECERLQAFPDDWTLIPWRGKPADQCPDGPRYKALGNSMACNCMAWIGERIDAYERTHAGKVGKK